MRFIRDHGDLAGVVHVTAPSPIQNRYLMAALSHRPPSSLVAPTPEWLVRLGAIVLRTDPALALTGRRISGRLLESGFEFNHPTINAALEDLLPGREGSGGFGRSC